LELAITDDEITSFIKTKTAETKITKLGTQIVHHDINIRSKVKVTGSQSIKALLLGARILEQPCSTARLFPCGCSFTLPLLGDGMAGMSYAPLVIGLFVLKDMFTVARPASGHVFFTLKTTKCKGKDKG